MIYNVKFEKVKGKKPLLIASNCIMFFLQVALLAFFARGLVEYFGVNISVVGAVDLIFDIANMAQGAILQYLLRFALGIIYFITAIIVVKNFITSISYFIYGVLSKDKNVEATQELSFCSLFLSLGTTIKCCFLFISLSLMTSVDFKITPIGKTVLIVGLVIYILVHILLSYFKNFDIKTIVYKSLSVITMATAFVLLTLCSNLPTFEQLILGVRIVFGGYLGEISATVICMAISLTIPPILYIFIQSFLILFLFESWSLDYYIKILFARAKATVIMSLAITIVFVDIVITMFFNNFEVIDLSEIYNIIIDKVPLLLTSIVLFTTFNFSKFEQKNVIINEVDIKKEKVKEGSTKQEIKQIDVKNIEVVSAKNDIKEHKEENINSLDIVAELVKYKDLFDKGLITHEEYVETKKKILGI